MKTRQQKARDKQFEQERVIAQSIVDLRTQREEFEKLIKEYEDSAFEAVQLGQAPRSKNFFPRPPARMSWIFCAIR